MVLLLQAIAPLPAEAHDVPHPYSKASQTSACSNRTFSASGTPTAVDLLQLKAVPTEGTQVALVRRLTSVDISPSAVDVSLR